MGFDQITRGRLQKFVNNSRDLLVDEFILQLQQDYGLDPVSGKVSSLEKLTHLDNNKKEVGQVLRDTMTHYLATDSTLDTQRCLQRVVREQAFTFLNRICAVRMAEARGIIIDSISSSYNSKGFQLYNRLVNGAFAETGQAYHQFLMSIFDEFALDLPALFGRYNPDCRLFPREKCLMTLLEMINQPDIAKLWSEDETIGWIFQYYNAEEERRKMRSESDAPRSSRELAVRNQFFTPRYVVEYLTDNTLGRTWYEMTRGATALLDDCRYLLRRPNEVFQTKEEVEVGHKKPGENIEGEPSLPLIAVPYRAYKDPRQILMLDPACGSMHFGLYAFDLYEKIYEDAWDLEEGSSELIGKENSLHTFYPNKADYLKDIPRLIIEENIHGIDIDPCAVQIACLSLWLRAEKSWQRQGIKPHERPRLRKTNIVCAEPMPGEREWLTEFANKLQPKVLGQLVELIFDRMKIVGETGFLLRIEDEIAGVVSLARDEFSKELLRRKTETNYLPGMAPEISPTLFDFADLPDKTQFWSKAEMKIIAALQEYASQSDFTASANRRLFSQDAARGFSFIDLCQKRYDVVLMNPPFGEISPKISELLSRAYPSWNKNLLCAFLQRGGGNSFR